LVTGCADALRDLRTVLYQCGSEDLAGLAGDLAELRALAGAALVETIAEAAARGAIDASQRRPALPEAPHHRAPRPTRRHRHRQPRRMGPPTRLLPSATRDTTRTTP